MAEADVTLQIKVVPEALPPALRGAVAGTCKENPGASSSASGVWQVTTVSEARAVLAEVTAERDELHELIERYQVRLQEAAEALERAHASVISLRDHDERAVFALKDVLDMFTRGSDGWARSAMVAPEDLDGWRGAASPWEGE
jgi:hypothetical protein